MKPADSPGLYQPTQRSGSTPHDAVTADPPPKRHPPFAPALDRHRPRSCRPVPSARNDSAILVNKPPLRSFSSARTPTPSCKIIGSNASPHPFRARDRAKTPIEPAAPAVPFPPRFRALALFGRRPSERADRLCIPASENLHKSGLQKRSREVGPRGKMQPVPMRPRPR
jgi:hypothetical protein